MTLNPDPKELEGGFGINSQPKDSDIYIDIDTPMGKCSAVYLNLIFQLPKWGFDRVKLDEKMDVSPVFQQYYQLTIKQKQELENMIKAALASISAALSDLEMLRHDLRKYKEFMDYFKMKDYGKEKKDEEMRLRGEQPLKSIFIDQVDAHTDLPNTPIALRSIVGRWPTIIADFMKLKDEDLDPKKIAKDYSVSEAQGVVLSTKNKLYQEWRDELFRRAVEERFRSLVQMVEARKKSFEEYKQMIKPTIRRYKSIVDGIGQMGMERAAFWRPDSQAMSLDQATIWCWKPFAVPEKYKAPREAPLDEISLEKAGFKDKQAKELVKSLLKEKKELRGLTPEEEEKKIQSEISKFKIKALPVEPSIDKIVQDYVEKIEREYGVKISGADIYKARQKLAERFEASLKGKTSYETWVFSPYYMFFEMKVDRFVARLPDGSEFEDLMLNRFTGWTITQNVMIVHLLELEAKDKQLDNYIGQMLGEMGVNAEGAVVESDELEKDYLIKLGEETKKKEEKKTQSISESFRQLMSPITSLLSFFGIKLAFFKARGPYEFIFTERITKYYMKEAGQTFQSVVSFIKSSFGVP